MTTSTEQPLTLISSICMTVVQRNVLMAVVGIFLQAKAAVTTWDLLFKTYHTITHRRLWLQPIFGEGLTLWTGCRKGVDILLLITMPMFTVTSRSHRKCKSSEKQKETVCQDLLSEQGTWPSYSFISCRFVPIWSPGLYNIQAWVSQPQHLCSRYSLKNFFHSSN